MPVMPGMLKVPVMPVMPVMFMFFLVQTFFFFQAGFRGVTGTDGES